MAMFKKDKVVNFRMNTERYEGILKRLESMPWIKSFSDLIERSVTEFLDDTRAAWKDNPLYREEVKSDNPPAQAAAESQPPASKKETVDQFAKRTKTKLTPVKATKKKAKRK